ncbi:MAG: xanthine dehydrogenase, partial [Phototrophicales bacterium]
GGTIEVFIEPVGISPTVLIIGMGHVGKALAEVAKWAGYRVIISDDRAEFCNEDYLPGMDGYVVCKPGDLVQHIDITPYTYIAAPTRGLPIDVQLIPTLLKTDAPYIGIIGSRRRWALTMNALKNEHGLADTDLARIHSPIGLEIEAETPQEIAISILAEIIMIRRGGSGQPMRWMGTFDEIETH